MRRERIRHDPLDALREAIVDALAHRGWTRYEEIEVFRCADRIEIPSPGALQNSMTIEKMGAGQRSPGNLPVSDVVRDYNDADSRGMGVLPLEFPKGESAASLGLEGDEVLNIEGVANGLAPGARVRVTASKNGRARSFEALCRLDSAVEVDYYRNGGILQTVMRNLAHDGA